MLQANIITKLREDYGFADPSATPDSKLVEYITSALNRISEYYPKIERDFVLTIPDTTRYTITKTGLIGIKEVFYSTGAGSAGGASSTLYANSSQFASIMDMEIQAHLTPSGSEVVSFNTFDLIPTPEEVLKVYYDYKMIRTLTDLPDIFEEDIYTLITNNVSTMKFRKSTSTSGAGGNPYKFDRKGNISEEPSSVMAETQKTLKVDLDSIIDNIKRKVMRL
jgi:hypothetical protein